MINIFVIEHFGERNDRKLFWETFAQQYEEDQSVRIYICPQDRINGYLSNTDSTPFALDSYDLIFVHDSDKSYNVTDNYIDRAQDRPMVCYSAGATSVDVSRLENYQIKVLPVEILKKNAAKFFRRLKSDGVLTVDAFNDLAGVDPRREAAIDLLQKFLPLDVELQLGDALKCKEQAELLIKEEAMNLISALYNRVYVAGPMPSIQNLDSKAALALKLKDRLMSLAGEVVTQGAASLDLIFGYQVDENGRVNKHDESGLREEGFHRTLERLRDTLLMEE